MDKIRTRNEWYRQEHKSFGISSSAQQFILVILFETRFSTKMVPNLNQEPAETAADRKEITLRLAFEAQTAGDQLDDRFTYEPFWQPIRNPCLHLCF